MYAKQSPPPSPVLLSQNSSSSSLPFPTPSWADRRSATAKLSKFLRRVIYFRHMDFEFALWQMLYLFISPQKVYRNFQYRKQTKDQFARDDPAFLVLLSFWLIVSSVGFSIVLMSNFVAFFKFLLWVIFVDCIGIGLVISTILWFISNHYLKKPTCEELDVEWGYAFDVHLNAFFPLLIILHLFQLFFYHVLINRDWFISCLFGNSLWLLSLGYYNYITFLGYSALPILKNTQILLYPMAIAFIMYITTLIGRWNICQLIINFYYYRVM